MSKKSTKVLSNTNILQILEIFLVIFWLFSWLNDYIKGDLFLYYCLLLFVITFNAILLIIKSLKWYKLIWVMVLFASIGASMLMVVSYNLSFNLQY